MNALPINGLTQLVGLLGWPVAHSKSPAMHNAAFAALGLNWAYVPLPVAPDQLSTAVAGLAALGFAGANVTVPHKQAVIPLMDTLTPAAQAIGAVNTLHRVEGRWLGDNTDAEGFIRALREGGVSPAGQRVVVLGAGGAARAVVYALGMAGAAEITIYNRTPAKAQTLVNALTVHLPHTPLKARRRAAFSGEGDLFVNATAVGMYPHSGASPWPEGIPLPAGAAYYDLVYNPLETHFLAQARAAGGRAVAGLGMLVHQGAAAFARWTGREPDTHLMLEACLRTLPPHEG